jgi:hypothetical protein
MVRVVLPFHLRTLAKVDDEVTLGVQGGVTQRSVVDALEAKYPPISLQRNSGTVLPRGGLRVTERAQYSTFTSHKPLAGAVGPALLRSRASRIRGMSSEDSFPLPTSRSVPTMFRTMWCRNPEPRIS